MNARGALGRYGEDLAARLLADAGMAVLERNWRCRAGEIDIVARDGDAVVFCEVKTRRAGCFEHPMEAVTPAKADRLQPARRDLARAARRSAPGRGPDRSGRCDPAPARGAGRRACPGRGLMGFARACSVALVGVEGVVVEVQADLEPGVAAFTLVGLPDKSLVESRDRVRAAVVNSGAEWPQKKLTVGLSPASVPKGGSGFDLAVACAVLGAAERIDPAAIADVVMIGELGLDGRVRPVRGVLPRSSRRPRRVTGRSWFRSRPRGGRAGAGGLGPRSAEPASADRRARRRARARRSRQPTGTAPTRCWPD